MMFYYNELSNFPDTTLKLIITNHKYEYCQPNIIQEKKQAKLFYVIDLQISSDFFCKLFTKSIYGIIINLIAKLVTL